MEDKFVSKMPKSEWQRNTILGIAGICAYIVCTVMFFIKGIISCGNILIDLGYCFVVWGCLLTIYGFVNITKQQEAGKERILSKTELEKGYGMVVKGTGIGFISSIITYIVTFYNHLPEEASIYLYYLVAGSCIAVGAIRFIYTSFKAEVNKGSSSSI